MQIAESEQSGCLTVEWPHFYKTKYKIILLHVPHAGQAREKKDTMRCFIADIAEAYKKN